LFSTFPEDAHWNADRQDSILVFIDRGGRFETNTDGTALVDIGAFAGDPPHHPRDQYRCHPSSLETLSALVLTNHAYDKLSGWSNVIPIVPGQRHRDRHLRIHTEESHGTRSTPHRHRT